MKSFWLKAGVAFGFLVLAGCAGSTPGNNGGPNPGGDDGDGGQVIPADPRVLEVYAGMGLPYTYDASLADIQKGHVQEGFVAIQSFKIPSARGDQRFKQVFGEEGEASVQAYLRQRLSLFVGADLNLTSAVRLSDFGSADAADAAQVLASNVGVIMWMNYEASQPRKLSYRIGGREIVPTQSRVGVVRVGKAFSKINALVRATTLVHEARHSDCTGGLDPQDVDRWRRDEMPQNASCGHLHAECPAGHDYAGIAACDDHPWGAYAIGWLYAQALQNHCAQCSERARTVARLVAADSYSRLLGDQLVRSDPDMSSSGLRTEGARAGEPARVEAAVQD